MSGHTSTGRLKDLDRKALSDTDNRNILIINHQDSKEKTQGKKSFF